MTSTSPTFLWGREDLKLLFWETQRCMCVHVSAPTLGAGRGPGSRAQQVCWAQTHVQKMFEGSGGPP